MGQERGGAMGGRGEGWAVGSLGTQLRLISKTTPAAVPIAMGGAVAPYKLLLYFLYGICKESLHLGCESSRAFSATAVLVQ